MKPIKDAGFTIVETMLFLGISGILAMGVLATIGGSINVQRYRDSVTSLRSTLQQQYSNVANVSNDNGGARGQSDEVILGKFIKTTGTTTLSIQTVKGKISGSNGSNDVETIKSYDISLLGDKINFDIEWGATIKLGSDNGFSILILRSPSSGVIRTFIDNEKSIDNDKIKDLINDPVFLTKPATICVDSGLSFSARMAVRVAAGATGPSGVQAIGDGSGC